MPHIMIILDGMEDDALPPPYEKGKRGGFLRLERESLTGLVNTTPDGRDTDSLCCILKLLGAKEEEIPSGRAAVEALAAGIPVLKDDLVLRCGLVRLEHGKVISSTADGLSEEEMERAVIKARPLLPQGASIYHLSAYRSLLLMPGYARRDFLTFAPHQHIGERFADLLPQDKAISGFILKTAQLLEPYALLPWGQAASKPVFRFQERFQKSAAMVCACEIARGIALSIGMELICPTGATGETDTNLKGKLEAVQDAAQRFDFVCLHINGCDEASHRGAPDEKAAFLTRIDTQLLAPLEDWLQPGNKLLVCADHLTSSVSRRHEREPVRWRLWEAGRCRRVERNKLTDAAELLPLLFQEGD